MPVPHPGDLAARIQRIEDRTAIIETVVTYATSIDAANWARFTTVFTDPVDHEHGRVLAHRSPGAVPQPRAGQP